MFVYLLYRWTITRRFEKAQGGFVYRKRPDLPGFVVTDQDRKDLLREFRRRYWKFWLLMLACTLACSALLAVVAMVFGFGQRFIELAGYALVLALLAFIAREQRTWSLLPEKNFAKCPRIEPEVPRAGWSDRFHSMMRNRSWISHIAIVLIKGTLAWLTSFDLADAQFGQWLLLIAFTASIVISLYGAAHKALTKADP